MQYGVGAVDVVAQRALIGFETARTGIENERRAPDLVVAEFFYGFGNNYAGASLGNLDVFLASLRKYSPKARVIVLVEKTQHQYVDKLAQRFPLYAVVEQPVRTSDIEPLLGRSDPDESD